MELWTDAQMRAIDKMLKPQSIAVVGASPKGGYGGRLWDAVLKAKDRVRLYPVNPNYGEISGIPAYRSISDLPEAPDLVGIVVPYGHVIPVLRECHEKKAGSAVIISAGFAERGNDTGLDMQRQLGAFVKETGLRFTGPNCLGLANVRDNIWPTASSRTLGGLTGHIGLVCQSGATAFGPFLLRAVDAGIGLSHIISTGNEVDLDFTDFARWLVDDPETRVIAGFVEGFKSVKQVDRRGRARGGARQADRAHQDRALGIRHAGGALAYRRADRRRCAERRGVPAVRHHPRAGLRRAAGDLRISSRTSRSRASPASRSYRIRAASARSPPTCSATRASTLPPLSDRARDGINAILKDFGWAANPADMTGFARSDSFPQIMDYMIEEPEVGTLVVASAGVGKPGRAGDRAARPLREGRRVLLDREPPRQGTARRAEEREHPDLLHARQARARPEEPARLSRVARPAARRRRRHRRRDLPPRRSRPSSKCVRTAARCCPRARASTSWPPGA